MDELQRALRDAARSHHPDRARILARVERGMDRPAPAPRRHHRPPAPRWPRVALAAAAVAGVLVVGGLGARAVLHEDAPAPARVADPPPATPTAPAPTSAVDGFLRARGDVDPHSNRFWAQSNITFNTATALTGLTVELRVAQTGGVADTGNWRTPPAGHFTVSVREEGGALVYTWTLREGRTVPVGRHVFAGQYNHAEGGRDAGGDRFTVTATGADGERATVTGGFASGPGATGSS
ncbi:hypothetical protein RND61_15965 [Streptomyces sp. TRM76323]|uniref:Anti-sigma factor n=1 Tax=Streptomyces tamarix TaxID=3078565 RepID=A0ABU3QL95_9ACTN|nr:hypothetical protein [Streptomyces tamarix]MDT9683545.1 hypothetical protein [Streptomyces tamarix]